MNEKQLEFLRTIMSNVDRMVALVSDLSDISRIETGRLRIEPAAVRAGETIRDVLTQMKPQFDSRRQVVETEIPADLPHLHTDPQRLMQILTNLLSNANKYTPEGGRIEIRAVREGPMVRITVRDHGIGMTGRGPIPPVHPVFPRANPPPCATSRAGDLACMSPNAWWK